MKSWLTGKDLEAGKDWRQLEKGWQRMKWLDSITDAMDVNLSKLWAVVKDWEKGNLVAVVRWVTRSQTWLSNWKTAPLFLDSTYKPYHIIFVVLCVIYFTQYQSLGPFITAENSNLDFGCVVQTAWVNVFWVLEGFISLVIFWGAHKLGVYILFKSMSRSGSYELYFRKAVILRIPLPSS